MEKKVISSFMFSESHEQDLLWLKLNVENDFVDEWVIIESTYTFQGSCKLLYLESVLEQQRFKVFKDKIKIIQSDVDFNSNFKISPLELIKRKIQSLLNCFLSNRYSITNIKELASFYSERNQRQLSYEYIVNKYSDNDIVLICDLDEIYDCTGIKYSHFVHLINSIKTPFYLKRIIFCYDYNNLTPRVRYNPIVTISDLKSRKYSFQYFKHDNKTKKTIDDGVNYIFEYTFCFNKQAMLKKLASFAHVTGYDEDVLNYCLSNNISLINPHKISASYKSIKENYYSLVSLSSVNSPFFLRDNFCKFKTDVVDLKYLNNRKQNKIE